MPRHTAPDDRRSTTDQPTMRDVDHTNPATGEPFGDSQMFQRGRLAVVDGGSSERSDDADRDDEPMGEIDHTPREGAPAANEVYARGVDADADAETDGEDDV